MAKQGEEMDSGLPVDPVVETVFKDVKLKRTKRLMVLVIKDDQITIEKIAKRKTNIEEAYGYFPETECRYIIWDVEDNSVNSKRPVSKLYFFTWCPQLANTRLKTLYSSQRRKRIGDVIKGAIDVHATTMNEVKEAIGEKVEPDSDEDENEDW
eukprot:CAMPEP_0204830226 /NCGR_PEP_ID=MMETSP1346-20131115/8410_1 /ASSEMBLY_ACC=CAM_ASM_000771 /TAXON_ID=215587 /ORGANISM="Aplanochytrium stocchinoi, Strain GSBS06" /LENGTH=152 /DNA_ID=CAMNT_0051960385 /DNA_START=202 /DNA_END=657 /DNA_ORIENTATION=-